MLIIILIVLVLLLFIILHMSRENFDKDMRVWLPIGYKDYGLRGNLISTHPIDDCYFDQYKCYTNTSFS